MPYSALKKTRQSFKSYMTARFGVRPLVESQSAIERWFETPLGQRVLSAEQEKIDKIMPEMYGYHLMQLSVLDKVKLSRESPVTHHFSLGVHEGSSAPALAHFEHLPIEAESIDTAVLHHVMEYSTNPHQLLRETARTIIPNGYINIIGFNPYSSLMLKKQLERAFTSKAHWRYNSLSCNRLVDWLRVLDFEPLLIQYGYHALPLQRGYRQGFDHFCSHLLPSCGAFYIIVARKSVVPMTLIKKPWKKTATLRPWGKGRAVQNSKIPQRVIVRPKKEQQ